jgi:membrane-associated phospholipid phosphatase
VVPERRVDLKVIEGSGPRTGGAGGRPGWGRVAAELIDSGESGLRPVDVLLLGYLLLTGLVILAWPRNLALWPLHLALRLVAVVVILRVVPNRPKNPVLAFVRDWYPILAFLPLYAELGTLSHLFFAQNRDEAVVVWEGALLGGQPSQTWRTLFPWPWLSEYLHFAYFYYYFVPATLGLWLWLSGDMARFSRALTATLGAFLTCCLIYVAFPVTGPYHHFGHPAAASWGGIFGPLVHGIVERGSSLGTAFPSSHTAVAVAVWLTAWRLCRPAFWILTLIVPALAFGTIYGGFHYALDTLAGAILGVFVAVGAPRVHAVIALALARRKGKETPPTFASQGRGRSLE